ncbi:hypothetical protein RCL1_004791 [Eukaryota sp. TZLM3-RCL]
MIPLLFQRLAVGHNRHTSHQNVPLVPSHQTGPVYEPDESFVSSASNVYIKFHYNMSNYRFAGRGSVFLTTQRLYLHFFVDGTPSVLPLLLSSITGDSFNQPIFAANNLQGISVLPANTGIINFKVTFDRGGETELVSMYFRVKSSITSSNLPPVQYSNSSEFVPSAPVAYMSSEDPNRLYLSL